MRMLVVDDEADIANMQTDLAHNSGDKDAERRRGRVMRMLVVDDEADIANMLAEYFRMEGYEVTAANDGPTALREVSSGSVPDLMLLDVNMPGMDGFEVCRRVREHVGCPIIFLTARVADVDQLDGFAAGADDYVMKPFSLEVLGRRVAAHMAREGRTHESGQKNAVRFFRDLTGQARGGPYGARGAHP